MKIAFPKIEYPSYPLYPAQKVYSFIITRYGTGYYIERMEKEGNTIYFKISTKIARKTREKIVSVKLKDLFTIKYDIKTGAIQGPNKCEIENLIRASFQ